MKMKKYIKLFSFIIIGLSISIICNGQTKQNKKDLKGKGNFHNKSFSKDKDPPPDPQLGVPDPDWESPINGGIGILIVGSLLFWGKKIKNEFLNE